MKKIVTVTRNNLNQPYDISQVLVRFYFFFLPILSLISQKAKAFNNDPCHHFFFQHNFEINELFLFRCTVDNLAVDTGIIKVTVEEENGNETVCSASVWFKSTNAPGLYSYLLKSGMWRYFGSPSITYRLLQWSFKIDPYHTKIMGNRPHYYLLYFGTDPNHEGRGNGAFLMKEQLKVVDEENLEAYLECSNPASCKFYEKYGFVTEHEYIEEGFPRVHLMKRPAQNLNQ